MKHKIEINFPKDYNYPYFTSEMVADILKQNPRTIRKKRKFFATEVTPGNYLWSKVDIEEYSQNSDGRGLKNIYEYNPNWKKKHLKEV